MVIHYWGADAIVRRIGLHSPNRLAEYIAQRGVPAYRRKNPKRPFQSMYYSNESLITAWEFANVRKCREDLLSKAEQREENQRTVQREKEKRASAKSGVSDIPHHGETPR